MYNILQWQLQNKYFFEMLKKKKKRKKNINLTNTSGYMVYGIFKYYNFHFNNYVGFSILIKGDNRTTFVVGEHNCLLCIAPTVSIAWEIPPFSGISDFVVSSGFPEEQQNGFNASINIKDGKSTLIFVVSKKMNQSLVRILVNIFLFY